MKRKLYNRSPKPSKHYPADRLTLFQAAESLSKGSGKQIGEAIAAQTLRLIQCDETIEGGKGWRSRWVAKG